MDKNSKKSRTKIIVIREPLTLIEAEENQPEEVFSEQVIKEYTDLKEKCEEIILKIKRRKAQELSPSL